MHALKIAYLVNIVNITNPKLRSAPLKLNRSTVFNFFAYRYTCIKITLTVITFVLYCTFFFSFFTPL